MENLSMQTRVMIAAILSFGFFIFFDTFYVQDIRKAQKEAQTQETQEQKLNIQNQAPASSPVENTSISMPNDNENIDLSLGVENDNTENQYVLLKSIFQ